MGEILNAAAAVFILVFTGWFAWESTLLVDEKKKKRGNNDN
jgi:hypothetical protein|tara:strand:+ start:6407 stop:6529 length:123 start_codon:yes stop_codon:yes gene_type:complete